MTIYLLGYMGSGKSTLGKTLAQKKGLKFLDFDAYIENKERKTIREIFKDKGEIYFRKIETQYLEEIVNNQDNTIISLGGGTPCYGNNLQTILKAKGTTVFIRVPVQELTKRLWEQRKNRPLLTYQDTYEKLEEYIRKHLFERNFYYNQADIKIDANKRSENEIIEELEDKLF